MVSEEAFQIDHFEVDPQLMPVLAIYAIPQDRLFPIPKWNPREGRTPEYNAWRHAVLELGAAFGLAEAELENMQAPKVTVRPPNVVTRQADPEAHARHAAEYSALTSA